MHRFGHFLIIDFYETWQKHVNLGDLEPSSSEIFTGLLFPKTDFSTRFKQFRSSSLVSSSIMVRRRKSPPKKGTFLPCPLSDSVNQIAQKHLYRYKCVSRDVVYIIYRVAQKVSYILCWIFQRIGNILKKILSLLHSSGNLQLKDHYRSHHTLMASLHYIVKY